MVAVTTPNIKHFSLPRFFYQQLTYKPFAAKDVDLSGQTAIVTGANTGVGLEISRQLLDLGISRLILAVRDQAKGQAAATKLAPTDPSRIEVWHLDLRDYDSVMAFADRAKSSLTRLDIAVLNAGICPAKRIFNAKTGHDEIIQVNYLSTALLAMLLLPVAKACRANQPAPTRITFTSSEFAALAKFKFDLGNEQPILAALDKREDRVDTVDRMFVSKLLGHFFLRELARRVPARVAVINAASPGAIHDSEFNRDLNGTVSGAVIGAGLRWVGNSSAVGARMVTDAAVNHGEETHGLFWSFQKPAA
ncbi:NAD(P)-binding protein [Canariomyces notabilis]|uniref:NAD(P)-binding protein n=1 Tax=Canariomyces notabilis TaxID=2074819 RepID=A0AAN6QGN5_9PEZI|nr:NAD(P)-binding protein [Canariomyces arenarius]